MSDLFDEEDIIGDSFQSDDKIVLDDKVDVNLSEKNTLDARRRLEQVLDEKRLKDELDDFVDY